MALKMRNLVSVSSLTNSSARLINARFRSGGASRKDGEGAQLIEVDLGESENNEIEVFGMNRLEDAIHRILVRRAAPDWLPFLPGASYWVPPRKNNVDPLNIQLRNPMTEEEAISLFTARGWPSAPHYLDGASPHQVKEVSVVKFVSLGDEEEEG